MAKHSPPENWATRRFMARVAQLYYQIHHNAK
nr:MAG TPA: hypothetical protein [Caudoviricetes sp.]